MGQDGIKFSMLEYGDRIYHQQELRGFYCLFRENFNDVTSRQGEVHPEILRDIWKSLYVVAQRLFPDNQTIFYLHVLHIETKLTWLIIKV